MKEEPNEIEDFFKRRLEDFASEPSEHLWKKISPKISTSQKRKFFYFPLFVLFLIWLVLMGVWFVPQKENAISISQKLLTQTSKDSVQTYPISEKLLKKPLLDSSKRMASAFSNKIKTKPSNIENSLPETASIASKKLQSALSSETKFNTFYSNANDSLHTERNEGSTISQPIAETLQGRTLSLPIANSTYVSEDSVLNFHTKNENFALLSMQNFSWKGNQLNFPHYQIDSILPQPFAKKTPQYLLGFIAPIYTFQYIIPNPNDSIWIDALNNMNAYSVSNTGFQIGIGYEKNGNKRWNTSFQLSYKSLKTKLNYHYLRSKPDSVVTEWIDAQTLLITPFYTEGERNVRMNFRNVALQIQIGYILYQSSSFSHQLRLGVALENNVGNHFQAERKSSIQRFWANLNGGYHLRYQFSPRLGVFLSPQLSYYWGNVVSEKNYQVRPHTFQIKFGVSWRWR